VRKKRKLCILRVFPVTKVLFAHIFLVWVKRSATEGKECVNIEGLLLSSKKHASE